MPLRNRIIMVERERPVRVDLSNRRTFIARYRRAMRDELPPNIQLRRPYRQRAAPRNKCQRPLAAVQRQDQGLVSILKIANRVIKNPLVKKLGRAVLNELSN